jgi:hypothetical protein
MGKVCSTQGVKMNAYRIWASKPEGKIPLAKVRRMSGGEVMLKLVLEN